MSREKSEKCRNISKKSLDNLRKVEYYNSEIYKR